MRGSDEVVAKAALLAAQPHQRGYVWGHPRGARANVKQRVDRRGRGGAPRPPLHRRGRRVGRRKAAAASPGRPTTAATTTATAAAAAAAAGQWQTASDGRGRGRQRARRCPRARVGGGSDGGGSRSNGTTAAPTARRRRGGRRRRGRRGRLGQGREQRRHVG